jgi:hypothetical protein
MRCGATSWRKRRGLNGVAASAVKPAQALQRAPAHRVSTTRSAPAPLDFTAREWISDAVDGWLENPHGGPTFWLSSGVSAIGAVVRASVHGDRLKFCRRPCRALIDVQLGDSATALP